MNKPKKLINFRADETLAEILQNEANRTHRSVSAFVRAILEMVLLPDADEEESVK